MSTSHTASTLDPAGDRPALQTLIVPPPTKVLACARYAIDTLYTDPDGCSKLAYFQRQFYYWDGTHHKYFSRASVESDLLLLFEKKLYVKPGKPGTADKTLDWDPTPGKVSRVLGAVRTLLLVDAAADTPDGFIPSKTRA